MYFRLPVLAFVILFLFGCASTSTTTKSPEVMNLQMKHEKLVKHVTARDQEIEAIKYQIRDLRAQLNEIEEYQYSEDPIEIDDKILTDKPKASKKPATTNKKVIRVPATNQQVQSALKNAGYYDGSIDGKIGSMTKKAIKEFQKDHGLKVDGVIGKKTWMEMKNYLE